MAVGLPDSPINRELAQRQAMIIQSDLQADRFTPGSFDPTLTKYRDQHGESAISVVKLFERFTEHKRKTLPDPDSIIKYRGLSARLKKYFKTRSAQAISENQSFEFRDWLLKELEPITARERIGMMRSCWHWGIKRKLLSENPWTDVKGKVPPKPKPFTTEEIKSILGDC